MMLSRQAVKPSENVSENENSLKMLIIVNLMR